MSRVTRTASVAGRRPVAVALMSITLPPGCSGDGGRELAAVDLGRRARDLDGRVGGRDRPAHLDVVVADLLGIVGRLELELHARLVRRRPRRLAAGGQHEARGEDEGEGAHPFQATVAT